MCQTDTTPDPCDMWRSSETPELPERGLKGTRQPAGSAAGRVASERPALREHPRHMPADGENEDADPVVDTGPGISDDVPAPESVPPVNNPDPQPGDRKPKAPPEDGCRPQEPVELPGRPGAVPETL